MLVSLGAQRLYEIVKQYAATTNKYVLVINNVNWFTLDATKQATVKTFYEDSIPEDEIGEVFAEHYTFYDFDGQGVAVDTANDWFPLSNQTVDADHFIECYVITPAGGVPYTNKIPDKPAE
tara:strand:+ start:11770 stop:12132 length:363 start_codon:yes stop_codon:yes gene_type:complete